jgi:homoaconitate hydratase
MGKGSIGNLSSAVCVAASSFDMHVTDPTAYLLKMNQDDFDRYRNWLHPNETTALPPFDIVEPSPSLDDGAEAQQVAYEQVAVAAMEAALPPRFTGKVQQFGDNIDTDAVIPAQFMGLNKSSPLWPVECETEEQVLASKSFAYVRPEFVQKVNDGFTIVVAGTAFGSGSSREEAAICLKAVGVKCVIAKSFAYIYARNQPNNALLGIVITDERFHELAQEGSEVTVDLRHRQVTVEDYCVSFSLTQLEENFLNGGGLKRLFQKYKADLFRAAMRSKGAPDAIATPDIGCGTSCSRSSDTAEATTW